MTVSQGFFVEEQSYETLKWQNTKFCIHLAYFIIVLKKVPYPLNMLVWNNNNVSTE